MLDLVIVIVNYRTPQLVIDCLTSIIADPSLPDRARVIVVDGASGDESCELISSAIAEHRWNERIAFAALPRNGGFAYGNNRAIEAADDLWGRARNYLLLNPDTVVRSGAIGSLVDFLADNPRAGIVGSSLEDPDGTRQACSFRFPTAQSELESTARFGPLTRILQQWRIVLPLGREPSQADWVSGASMLVRASVIDQIGSLDENYFLYYEELDFCRRAVDAGWQCWTAPQSRVVHLCGQSTGISSKGQKVARRPAYWFNSRNLYFIKHHGRGGRALADLGWILGHFVWRLRQLVQRRPNDDPPHLIRDFIANRMLRTSSK